MFSCTGNMDTCKTAARLSDGEVTAPEALTPWDFIPTDPNAMIATVTDDKHLTFGWWLDKSDGTEQYYFDAFAMATGMTPANSESPDNTELTTTNVGTLQGTATYEGAAVGKYTILDSTLDSAEGGHFTASATLKANFNADPTHWWQWILMEVLASVA